MHLTLTPCYINALPTSYLLHHRLETNFFYCALCFMLPSFRIVRVCLTPSFQISLLKWTVVETLFAIARLVCCLISLREIQKFDRNNSFNKHVFISKQDLDLLWPLDSDKKLTTVSSTDALLTTKVFLPYDSDRFCMVDLKAELHYPFQQHNIRFMLASVFSQERMKSTRMSRNFAHALFGVQRWICEYFKLFI